MRFSKSKTLFRPAIACFFLFLFSCNRQNSKYVNLGHDYWYKSTGKSTTLIESRNISYHNKIYPIVTDYSFNEDFIIAEQQFDENATTVLMGTDLYYRFEDYRLYKRDSNIINTSFYNKLKGIVEKDSGLYKSFIEGRASDNESDNRTIATLLAQKMIKAQNLPSEKKELRYWILIHSDKSLVGPLTKGQYYLAKDSIGIPASLKLKFERERRD